jgi:hypothetical protein
MSSDTFYAILVSFHPDPKVEHKKQFSTREEAQKHIDAIGKDNECWMIIKSTNGSCELVRGFKYHDKNE